MKKTIWVAVFTAYILTACVTPYNVSENLLQLRLSFTNPQWDGETIPPGQQCQKFGGKASGTPQMKVEGIPIEADALVVEYTDRSWGPIGGHGKIGYYIEPGADTIVIPSVPGHSFDLPEGFFLVSEHAAPHWDTAGAYLPPCSGAGGVGNRYYAIVKAIVGAKSEGEKPLLVARGSIEMGRF